jgi:hypothetical protein
MKRCEARRFKKRKAINARINERNMHKTSPLIHVTQFQHQQSGKERKKQQQKTQKINQ